MEILTRAPRGPDGRVKGVPPPRLIPKPVRRLTQFEIGQLTAMQQESNALRQKQIRLFASLGLDPRKSYRINDDGDLLEIGVHTPVY